MKNLLSKNGYWYLAHEYSYGVEKCKTDTQKHDLFANNWARVNKACGYLMDPNYFNLRIFSPISQCHPVAEAYKLPRNWEYWKRIDETFIDMSLGLIVTITKNWDKSTGVTAEIEYAQKLDKPILYLHVINDEADDYYLSENSELTEIEQEKLKNYREKREEQLTTNWKDSLMNHNTIIS